MDRGKYIRTSLQFEHLIDDPTCMQFFFDFLAKHAQSHLLIFWLDVEAYERVAGGGGSLVSEATRIYESYLSEEKAPHRIELPESMQQHIQSELSRQRASINLFSAAHTHVLRRLRCTWYPSFLLSNSYKSLLEFLQKSFQTTLKEVLVDEVQSRYLEAFILSDESRVPAHAVGNVYFWKKVHHDLRPLGTRVAGAPTPPLSSPPPSTHTPLSMAITGEDIRAFISEGKACYDTLIAPAATRTPRELNTPPADLAHAPKSTRSSSTHAMATAISIDLRHRLADALGKLVSQSRYYAGLGSSLIAIDRALVLNVVNLLVEAQKAVYAYLDSQVYPSFCKSMLCGVLEGDMQAKRSATMRRKRRLRALFKSVRSFRNVYVPPCPRSDGQGVVLVSTEGLSAPPPEMPYECLWAFDVRVSPVDGEEDERSQSPINGISDDRVTARIVANKGAGGTITFKSELRASEAVALDKCSHAPMSLEGRDGEICSAVESTLMKEVQRLSLPSVCLMPLEHSTFILFSPKLRVPDATIHHFVCTVPRPGGSDGQAQSMQSPWSGATPRSPVVTDTGDAVEPPGLSNDGIALYGACLVEWQPAPEALVPRCLTLVSTQARVDSLRSALLRIHKTQPPTARHGAAEDTVRTVQAGEGKGQQRGALASELSPSRPAQPTPTDLPAMLTADLLANRRGPPSWRLPTWVQDMIPNAVSNLQLLEAPLLPLVQALSPETLLKVWSALLLERPVVLKSQSKSLCVLCAEAFKRLLFPLSWLRPYRPLLPLADVCAFWDSIRKSIGGSTWFDYWFESDGLDDSLAPPGAEMFNEPVSASSARIVPGFLVGVESCVVDAALHTPSTASFNAPSPAYREPKCNSWAAAPCQIHDDWGGEAPLSERGPAAGNDFNTILSPSRAPSTRSTSAHAASMNRRTSARHLSLPHGGNKDTTAHPPSSRHHHTALPPSAKYGDLPACVKASIRDMVMSAIVVDLDHDTLTEPTSDHFAYNDVPVVPAEAAMELLMKLRVVMGCEGSGGGKGAKRGEDGLGGYGCKQIRLARTAKARVPLSSGWDQDINHDNDEEEETQESNTGGDDSRGGGGEDEGGVNARIHEAFLAFFRVALLERYREFTLSYLEDQMVSFNADAFLASQPEPSHAFWLDFFNTRAFAQFLALEHARIANTYEDPKFVPPPRPDTPNVGMFNLTASMAGATPASP